MEHAHQQDEGQNEIQACSVENLVAVSSMLVVLGGAEAPGVAAANRAPG